MTNRAILDITQWVTINPTPAIITAGVYHNSTLWLISLSSDGANWVTIADKNLWATEVYNDWDELSQANCGNYFQRWNNYGFAFSGGVSNRHEQVDASAYWPWNYYSDYRFRREDTSRDSSYNNNLWWGVTGTLSAMQWPCGSWFHIPTTTEWANIVSILTAVGIGSRWSNLKIYLKLPMTWFRDYETTNVDLQWARWSYWTSIAWTGDTAKDLDFSNFSINTNDSTYRAYWLSIRAFKNDPIIPDSTRTCLFSKKWGPNADTIAYYPLNSTTTTNDMKWFWTAYNLIDTASGSGVWFGTAYWVDCAVFSSIWYLINSINLWAYPELTLNVWFINYSDYDENGTQNKYVLSIGDTASIRESGFTSWYHHIRCVDTKYKQWQNLCVVIKNSWATLYQNWVYENSCSIWWTNPSIVWICIWNNASNPIYSNKMQWWWVSEAIIEKRAWTAEEALNYYNKTKDDHVYSP